MLLKNFNHASNGSLTHLRCSILTLFVFVGRPAHFSTLTREVYDQHGEEGLKEGHQSNEQAGGKMSPSETCHHRRIASLEVLFSPTSPTLGGGFRYLLFLEMIQFDLRIFFKWVGSTTN